MYQITDEEFEKAQRIIDEYHRERQQQAEWDLEDDEERNDYDPEDDDSDMYDSRLGCECGAWSYGPKGFIHLADCVCGAE